MLKIIEGNSLCQKQFCNIVLGGGGVFCFCLNNFLLPIVGLLIPGHRRYMYARALVQPVEHWY